MHLATCTYPQSPQGLIPRIGAWDGAHPNEFSDMKASGEIAPGCVARRRLARIGVGTSQLEKLFREFQRYYFLAQGQRRYIPPPTTTFPTELGYLISYKSDFAIPKRAGAIQ